MLCVLTFDFVVQSHNNKNATCKRKDNLRSFIFHFSLTFYSLSVSRGFLSTRNAFSICISVESEKSERWMSPKHTRLNKLLNKRLKRCLTIVTTFKSNLFHHVHHPTSSILHIFVVTTVEFSLFLPYFSSLFVTYDQWASLKLQSTRIGFFFSFLLLVLLWKNVDQCMPYSCTSRFPHCYPT